MKKLAKLFTSFLFLIQIYQFTFIVDNTNAQWEQTNGPHGGNIYSLAVSGNNIFAGTYNYGVYRSTNNGISWIQTPLNNITVYSLAISGSNIFAGTLNYGVYLSTNNGISWTQTELNYRTVKSLAISGSNIFAGTKSMAFVSPRFRNKLDADGAELSKCASSCSSGSNIVAGTVDWCLSLHQ
ncbi:MAG: hypothetical protein IPG02_14730 [Ignavibacteria bacterium]|nr:hypothetical protein [Ignavibacteria bacterium]